VYSPLCVECRSRICEHVCPRPKRVLKAREVQALEGLSRGLCNKEIAAELELAEGTVKVYISGIFRVLRVSSRLEAALWAAKHLHASLAPSPSGECATRIEDPAKG
jgi:DNA-binding NarL/FixJ family response regulator